MRINVIFRNFSGLEGSFNSKKWKPLGSPVLINFIKHLDKIDDLQILLIDENKKKEKFIIKEFNFENLRSKICLINKNYFCNKSIFFKSLNNLIMLSVVIYKSLLFRSDSHYVDNQNVLAAALLTLVSKKVTLRLLGAWGINFEMSNHGFFSKIRKLSYSSNFHNVICTDDGSNFENILNNKIFPKKVSVHHLLNGSEFNNFRIYNLRRKLENKKFRVLHYGRFDIDKGTHKFIKSIHSLIKENKNIEFIIFGYGIYFNFLKNYVKKYKLHKWIKIYYKQNIIQINKHLSNCDLYVSTNLIGSLSNSSLEALGYGMPAIFIDTTDKKNHTLKKNLKKNYFYFSEKHFEKDLKKLLLKYYKNPYLLKLNSIIIKSKFQKKIFTWERRIKIERELLLK